MTEIPNIHTYFKGATAILEQVLRSETHNLDRAAQLITDSLSGSGVLHIFGAGHGHLFSEELAYRAGGLVPINPIIDYGYTLMGGSASRSTKLERLEGYSRILMGNYEFRQGEVIVIVSQSGINPGPIEVALVGREEGLQVIAVTSLGQSKSMPSRHSSGMRLFEVADVIIDNHVPIGDALVELKPDFPKVAAVSTVIGAAILQSLVAEVALRLLDRGLEPPIWVSANVPEGDEHNQRMAGKYPSRLKAY
jgi:uncharacterized phosphosugar-binding protein